LRSFATPSATFASSLATILSPSGRPVLTAGGRRRKNHVEPKKDAESLGIMTLPDLIDLGAKYNAELFALPVGTKPAVRAFVVVFCCYLFRLLHCLKVSSKPLFLLPVF